MARIPGIDRPWYRYVTGQPLDGRYRTDATYTRAGQKQLSPTPVRRWSYRPGYQRQAVRLGVPVVITLGGWQYLTHPERTLWVVGIVVYGATMYALLRAWNAYQVRTATRRYVNPLGAVLGPLLGYSPATPAASFVTVPTGWEKDETRPVVVQVPPKFAGADGEKAQVATVILGRLGRSGDQVTVNWRLVGEAPSVAVGYRPTPPDMFRLNAGIDIIRDLEPGKVLIGMGARNKPAIMNFNGEDPHTAINANTGTGKSTQQMLTAAQIIRNGGQYHAIDPKMTSFDPLIGVPGFFVANNPLDVDEMWNRIGVVHAEFTRRQDIFKNDRTVEFPLWFMAIDEMTIYRKIDRQYWSEIKEKKDLMTSPGAKMLDALILMGRQYGIRVIASGQVINEAIMWNNLSVFANRAMAKYDENAWKRLFAGYTYEVPSTRPGRWVYRFSGGAPTWVQNLYATDQEIRDLAMEGTTRLSRESVPSGVGGRTTSGFDVQVTGDIVGVKAMAAYAGVPYETFKQRRTRAEGIPGERKENGQWVITPAALDAFLGRKPLDAP